MSRKPRSSKFRSSPSPQPGQLGFDVDGGIFEVSAPEVVAEVPPVPEWTKARNPRLTAALTSLRLRNRSLGSKAMYPGGRTASKLRQYEGGHEGVVERVNDSDAAYRRHLLAACGSCGLYRECSFAGRPDAFDEIDTFHYADNQKRLADALTANPAVNCSTVVAKK